ncbi:hypothetical protein SALCHL_002823 [Streptomyces albus subsp. chlorinus]|uniref:hypothetical protein n=1 Tax=Streptomyces albus TaxID=1888 RepID=UPI0015703816|nr:hypothetical protein [Streptomyces albus]
MSDWTVFGLLEEVTRTLLVAAVVPGDATRGVTTVPSDGFDPVARVVDAPTSAEAASRARDEIEGAEPMPAGAGCYSCRGLRGGDLRFRDAFGHDKHGHRLSNMVMRAGYCDAESLLAADLTALDVLPGMGAVSRARVRRARRCLRSA